MRRILVPLNDAGNLLTTSRQTGRYQEAFTEQINIEGTLYLSFE